MIIDDSLTNFWGIARAARFAALLDAEAAANNLPNLELLLERPEFKAVPVAAMRLLCWSYQHASEEKE